MLVATSKNSKKIKDTPNPAQLRGKRNKKQYVTSQSRITGCNRNQMDMDLFDNPSYQKYLEIKSEIRSKYPANMDRENWQEYYSEILNLCYDYDFKQALEDIGYLK